MLNLQRLITNSRLSVRSLLQKEGLSASSSAVHHSIPYPSNLSAFAAEHEAAMAEGENKTVTSEELVSDPPHFSSHPVKAAATSNQLKLKSIPRQEAERESKDLKPPSFSTDLNQKEIRAWQTNFKKHEVTGLKVLHKKFAPARDKLSSTTGAENTAFVGRKLQQVAPRPSDSTATTRTMENFTLPEKPPARSSTSAPKARLESGLIPSSHSSPQAPQLHALVADEHNSAAFTVAAPESSSPLSSHAERSTKYRAGKREMVTIKIPPSRMTPDPVRDLVHVVETIDTKLRMMPSPSPSQTKISTQQIMPPAENPSTWRDVSPRAKPLSSLTNRPAAPSSVTPRPSLARLAMPSSPRSSHSSGEKNQRSPRSSSPHSRPPQPRSEKVFHAPPTLRRDDLIERFYISRR